MHAIYLDINDFFSTFDCCLLKLEPPKGTNEKCPRKNGFFAHPDAGVCNVFYNCIDGDAIEITCTSGLHFDEYTGTCVWPDTAQRENCKSQEGKCVWPIKILHL